MNCINTHRTFIFPFFADTADRNSPIWKLLSYSQGRAWRGSCCPSHCSWSPTPHCSGSTCYPGSPCTHLNTWHPPFICQVIKASVRGGGKTVHVVFKFMSRSLLLKGGGAAVGIVMPHPPIPTLRYFPAMDYIDTKAKCRHLNNLHVKGLCGQCLSEFLEFGGTISHVGISDPALWTVAPLTFSLVQLSLSSPPPPVWISMLYTRIQCVRRGGMGFWASDR